MPVTEALGRQESQAEPRLCLYLAGDVTELVECLPSKYAGLDSVPIPM